MQFTVRDKKNLEQQRIDPQFDPSVKKLTEKLPTTRKICQKKIIHL